ncbi:MAG: hydrogenase expression/formation protein [Veillonellaceae bacterium]|nr:hydrogenase expression/formation protein [Veillonellaceae bacterium]
MDDNQLPIKVKAVLVEIKDALSRFLQSGESWTIFIDKMALSFEERQAIHDFLGQGTVTVKFNDVAEPVEWLESGVAGVWYGVFYNAKGNPILETIEISAFPELAAAQSEDAAHDIKIITEKLGLA